MGRKKGDPSKIIGFRVSQETHQFLESVAKAREIDLSALINTIIADATPSLRTWLSRHHAQQERPQHRGVVATITVSEDGAATVSIPSYLQHPEDAGLFASLLERCRIHTAPMDQGERAAYVRQLVQQYPPIHCSANEFADGLIIDLEIHQLREAMKAPGHSPEPGART